MSLSKGLAYKYSMENTTIGMQVKHLFPLRLVSNSVVKLNAISIFGKPGWLQLELSKLKIIESQGKFFKYKLISKRAEKWINSNKLAVIDQNCLDFSWIVSTCN